MTTQKSEAALDNARRNLRGAEGALNSLAETDSPELRAAALSRLLAYGEAVVALIRALRPSEPGFGRWFAPWEREMGSDPFLGSLAGVRAQVVREAEWALHAGREIRAIHIPQDLPPAPENARDFFTGDEAGVSAGWSVWRRAGTKRSMRRCRF